MLNCSVDDSSGSYEELSKEYKQMSVPLIGRRIIALYSAIAFAIASRIDFECSCSCLP